MNKQLYMFKASGLQRYIFATNRLRDAVGASLLITHLTEDLLDRTLNALDAKVRWIQRTAGSVSMIFEDAQKATLFFERWPLIVAQYAPGLEHHQWMAPIASQGLFETMQQGWSALTALRSQPHPVLPETTPVMIRTPLSGEAAVGYDPRKSGESVCASMRRKRHMAVHTRHVVGFEPSEVDPQWEGCQWTNETDAIARGEKTYMAVVHADGNQLGRFLIALSDEIRQVGMADEQVEALYRDFSTELAKNTRQALLESFKAQMAQFDIQEVNGVQYINARPIILGGDDVTFLVPSVRARQITAHFLKRFEHHTQQTMDELAKRYPKLTILRKTKGFSACAGIVYQRAKQPLIAGFECAEHLCRYAKDHEYNTQKGGEDDTQKARKDDTQTESSLMFSRLLDSAHGDFEMRLHRKFVDPQTKLKLTAGPYGLHTTSKLVSNEALDDLVHSVSRLSSGALRGVIDQLQLSSAAANVAYQRIGQIQPRPFERLHARLERVQNKTGQSLFAPLSDIALLGTLEGER